jgi:acyl carrier protein
VTTSSSPTVEIRSYYPRPVDVRALIRNTFQEFDDDADRKDEDPLMDAGLDSLSALSFRSRLIKVFCTPVPGTLIFDYPTIAGKAHYIETKAGTVQQQCAPTREPHAANLEEPCVTIPPPLVVMSPIDGPRVSSRGVIVRFTGNCDARMVAMACTDPQDVLTSSAARKQHVWQNGWAVAGTAQRASSHSISSHVVTDSPILTATSHSGVVSSFAVRNASAHGLSNRAHDGGRRKFPARASQDAGGGFDARIFEWTSLLLALHASRTV